MKPYTFAKYLKFFNKTVNFPIIEDCSSNSSYANDDMNFVEIPSKSCSNSGDDDGAESDNAEPSENKLRFEAGNSSRQILEQTAKILQRKMEGDQSEGQSQVAAIPPNLLEIANDRHILFFRGILPSLHSLTEDEIIELQMGVLELIINMKKNRTQT